MKATQRCNLTCATELRRRRAPPAQPSRSRSPAAARAPCRGGPTQITGTSRTQTVSGSGPASGPGRVTVTCPARARPACPTRPGRRRARHVTVTVTSLQALRAGCGSCPYRTASRSPEPGVTVTVTVGASAAGLAARGPGGRPGSHRGTPGLSIRH
jgi:hypothetical protein